jgi:hypothetical protein
MTRGTVFHSIAAGARDVWGEDGLSELLAKLPDETRHATSGAAFTPLAWYPTRFVLDWDEAKMNGPARGNEEAFRKSVARGIDFGFGRVRRAFLSFATPILLAERAAALWRHDQTHGEISVDSSARDEGRARLTLRDHPFIRTTVSRIAFSEVVRHILSLSRAKNVRETHAASADGLVVALTWDV